MLEVEDLHTDYYTGRGSVQAVRGVDFVVRSGSATALVGESGSGKSTAALSIMRLITRPIGDVVGGRIRLDGRDLLPLNANDMRDVLRNDIGYIPQDPVTALDPLFTIRTQIAEATSSKKSRQETTESIVALLERLGVLDARSVVSKKRT
jgi:ABC-type dipeptide/oligopeptide/nickel transport system ATPase component